VMSEQSGSRREPDDAMARQSLEVSEDAQPITTDEHAKKTAQGLEGTAGPERTDTADKLQTE
jgi:acyl dehydratase